MKASILLSLFPALLLLVSCGSSKPPKEPEPSARKLDVSFDSANRSLFYSGTASTSGNFEDEISFSLWFSLAADSQSAENEASRFLLDNHGPHLTQRASYELSESGVATISLLNGRLNLRGTPKRNGAEFEGTWYFDGLPGGGFWIAPAGTIFP